MVLEIWQLNEHIVKRRVWTNLNKGKLQQVLNYVHVMNSEVNFNSKIHQEKKRKRLLHISERKRKTQSFHAVFKSM